MNNPVRLEAPGVTELSWLEIDLKQLEANARAVREALDTAATCDQYGRSVPPAEQTRTMICAVVKKDAYALGSVNVAHRLMKTGVDMLAVYSPDEAEHLIANAVTCPILVLMPLRELNRTDGLYRHAVAEKLHLSIHDTRQLGEINTIGQQLGIKLPCHLYIDTGMSRSGLSPEQALDVLNSTTAHRYVRIAGVFTHFACSDTNPEFSYRQLDLFNQTLEKAGGALPADAIRHAGNSASMLRGRAMHLDMVRPGLCMLGYAPSTSPDGLTPDAGPWMTELPKVKPILRWCSRVIHIQRYPRRTPVSYGSTHKLKRESVLGIVPVGHGDGYPVALSNKADVRVHLKDRSRPVTECRVLGQVSMDQIVVDLTDLVDDPSAPNEHLLDAWAELYSTNPDACNAVPRLATLAKTNAYEMLCRLSPGLPRKYIH
ncbi:MAG: alanine racemase [Planctomycetota bacterium]